MKKFILVLSLIATLGLVSTVQAGTIIEPDLSQSQLRSDPLAAFEATANIGAPMSKAEASEMRGEVIPAVVIVALGTISYYGLVYGVPFALNYAASLSNGSWYVKNEIKESVKRRFGW